MEEKKRIKKSAKVKSFFKGWVEKLDKKMEDKAMSNPCCSNSSGKGKNSCCS